MLEVKSIPVKELMSREVVIVGPKDPIDRIEQLFLAYNIHHIPVVDEEGRLKGIISKGDLDRIKLAVDLYFTNNDEKVKAENVMTGEVAYVSPDATIGEAADIFMANIFHALPVLREGRLVGILTTHDLLKYCFSDRKLIEK
jgi:acetoin utilization protein AcuB